MFCLADVVIDAGQKSNFYDAFKTAHFVVCRPICKGLGLLFFNSGDEQNGEEERIVMCIIPDFQKGFKNTS